MLSELYDTTPLWPPKTDEDRWAQDKMNARRVVYFITDAITTALEPEENEVGEPIWQSWTLEAWEQYLKTFFDYCIDRRIIQEYDLEHVMISNGEPYVAVIVMPFNLRGYAPVKIEVTRTKNITNLEEIL